VSKSKFRNSSRSDMREVILLIDDSAAIHQLVRSHLDRRYEILSAYDGKTGSPQSRRAGPT
jgi:PleD family two-component response regulator